MDRSFLKFMQTCSPVHYLSNNTTDTFLQCGNGGILSEKKQVGAMQIYFSLVTLDNVFNRTSSNV